MNKEEDVPDDQDAQMQKFEKMVEDAILTVKNKKEPVFFMFCHNEGEDAISLLAIKNDRARELQDYLKYIIWKYDN